MWIYGKIAAAAASAGAGLIWPECRSCKRKWEELVRQVLYNSFTTSMHWNWLTVENLLYHKGFGDSSLRLTLLQNEILTNCNLMHIKDTE